MIPNYVILAVLGLLLLAAAVTLWLDARERRMNRQLETALQSTPTVRQRSIRRAETSTRAIWLYRLTNYNPDVDYIVHPAVVLLVAGMAASAVIYANRLFQFPELSIFAAAAVVALFAARFIFGWQRRRFANLLFRQLPDTVQVVTSTVRAGLPVNEAFRNVARDGPQPTARQFAIVCSEIAMGRPPEEAVEGIYERTRVAEYGMFAVTLGVQLKSGGSLAETLQTLAETVSQRVALAARAKAMSGEVIFSARALSLAPLIVGGVLYMISPSSIDLLFTDPVGNKLLAYAAGSVIVGSLVIRWLVKRETEV